MLTVSSYLKCIPPGNSKPEKPAIIKNFIEGVNKTGDKGLLVDTYMPLDTDVALIQGFVHADSKPTPHIILRRNVYDNQVKRGKRCIIVDSNLFLAYDNNNSRGYLRYSYDGIFANTGEYCTSIVDPQRWEMMREMLGIEVKPWKEGHNGHILICCQRHGGWSMQGQDVFSWLEKVIKEVRLITGNPIVVRFHPGDKLAPTYPQRIRHLTSQKVYASTNRTIFQDLQNACCMIGHNSSPGIIAAIEGVPVFLTDAGRSQAMEVAHHSFNSLLEPQHFDREPWLQKLAMCHWTLEESKQGLIWTHMRKWADKNNIPAPI